MPLIAKPIPLPPKNLKQTVVVQKKTAFKDQNGLSLSQEQRIFSLNVSKLIQFIYSKGFACTFAEAYRTPEQAAIYAEKRIGIKNSLHCKRLAVDLDLYSPAGKYIVNAEDYEQFGKYWETLHSDNRWGGRFKIKDADHFEMQDL